MIIIKVKRFVVEELITTLTVDSDLRSIVFTLRMLEQNKTVASYSILNSDVSDLRKSGISDLKASFDLQPETFKKFKPIKS